MNKIERAMDRATALGASLVPGGLPGDSEYGARLFLAAWLKNPAASLISTIDDEAIQHSLQEYVDVGTLLAASHCPSSIIPKGVMEELLPTAVYSKVHQDMLYMAE